MLNTIKTREKCVHSDFSFIFCSAHTLHTFTQHDVAENSSKLHGRHTVNITSILPYHKAIKNNSEILTADFGMQIINFIRDSDSEQFAP